MDILVLYYSRHGATRLLAEVMDILRDNLVVLEDALPYLPVFLEENPPCSAEARAVLEADDGRIVLEAFQRALREVAGGPAWHGTLMSRIQEWTGFRGRRLLLPVRAAVTGLLKGPELERILAWLGRDKALKRAERALLP